LLTRAQFDQNGHCEEQSDVAISRGSATHHRDCRAALAM